MRVTSFVEKKNYTIILFLKCVCILAHSTKFIEFINVEMKLITHFHLRRSISTYWSLYLPISLEVHGMSLCRRKVNTFYLTSEK